MRHMADGLGIRRNQRFHAKDTAVEADKMRFHLCSLENPGAESKIKRCDGPIDIVFSNIQVVSALSDFFLNV